MSPVFIALLALVGSRFQTHAAQQAEIAALRHHRPKVELGGKEGQPRAVVEALGEEGRIEVQLLDWPAGQEPPRLLLVPTTEALGPESQILAWEACPKGLFARSELQPGKYILAFVEVGEPTD